MRWMTFGSGTECPAGRQLSVSFCVADLPATSLSELVAPSTLEFSIRGRSQEAYADRVGASNRGARAVVIGGIRCQSICCTWHTGSWQSAYSPALCSWRAASTIEFWPPDRA